MQNHTVSLLRLERLLPLRNPPLTPHSGRILAVMTPIQRSHQLRENGPHELLVGEEVALLQLLHVAAQVAVAAVLHVQVQVVAGLEVLAVAVLHDVRVAQGLEDAQLGVQLGLLAVGHARVGDLLAAEDLVGGF